MEQSPSTILPLSSERQQQVIEETQTYIRQAKQLFNIKHTVVDIVFNLKGRAAGMYRVKQNLFRQSREIRYNPYIFSKYFDDNLRTTVPHEVAHYVSDIVHGLKNIKPHGREWKEIMLAFDADAAVTANYDLSGIPKKNLNSFTYRCACGDRQLSSIRHNKIKKRRYQYYCKICRQTLQYKVNNCS
ncbi:MAG: SprT-like domain-containing protein [Gammaproteobacteria bacterium]